MRHARISGWLLVATGLLHVATGVAAGWAEFAAMANDGIWMGAMATPERRFAAWFTLAGAAFLLPGLLASSFDHELLPKSFGWALLGFSVTGTLLFGPSGFLLVMPQAIYILVVGHRRGP